MNTLWKDVVSLRIKFQDFGMQGNAEVVLEGGTDLRYFSQWAIYWVKNKFYWVDVLKNHTLHVMDQQIKKDFGSSKCMGLLYEMHLC